MKVLKFASIGLSFGFLCTTFFMTLSIGVNDFTAQLIVWCIASIIFGVSAMISDVQRLSMLRATIIHYIICLSCVLIIANIFYQGLMSLIFGYFTITYIVIYIILYLSEKRATRHINEILKKR